MRRTPDEAVAPDRRIDRRAYLTAVGLATGSGVLAGRLSGRVAGQTTIDLGNEGLSPGDAIDPYLEEHFRSGVTVAVPPGAYEWGGNGLGGRYSGAALEGEGDVSLEFTGQYWDQAALAVDGGDLAVRNLTFRGPLESGGNDCSIQFEARHPESQVTVENVALPDGDVGHGNAIGIHVGREHAGTVHLRRCHVEGFPNNGLYAGAYGASNGGGGRIVADHCLFKNNNIDAIRLGGTRDTVRNCVVVQNDVPAVAGGAKSGRALRVRYPGQDISIENLHVTQNVTAPIVVDDQSDAPTGYMESIYIENNTDARAIEVESGHWSSTNVHLTGSGSEEITGVDSLSDVHTGDDAQSPATSVAEL